MDRWHRRDVLKSGAALGAGSLSLTTTTSVRAAPGQQEWVFETGWEGVFSPTVVDGTVFVGARDSTLYAVDTKTGEQQWAHNPGADVDSSPTVVDGTLYVGSKGVFAVDAGVSGSSEGSRAMLEALGHHGDWQHAGQSIDISTPTPTETPTQKPSQSPTQTATETPGQPATETTSVSGPGFGVVAALTSLGGAGYLLSSRASKNDD
ncbi:outer membrane protein assembly factor BamB family protein [Halorhabdus rudnickae]|uniref:outer membrane protein assembly factor BamB family protein n=1 Tax=Halorhabdus rudnickae TaxID=1775544 RepID=UPI001083BAFD|nr:PQQ-binding-like beta-propeller repeat protein [Halorhabdus rudnickae]